MDVFDGDPITAELRGRVNSVFESEPDIFVVATGTASNGLALAAMCKPYGSVLCHWDAHIQTDECGGPILFTGGATLSPLDGQNGKITLSALKTTLENSRFGVAHRVQPQVLSLTQATEAGTLYGLAELAELTAVARHYGLRTHVDGARFANAVATLECTPAELSWKSGIDVLSLGATKNGAIAAEAVIVFDKGLSQELRYLQKRSGHFMAKSSLHNAVGAVRPCGCDGSVLLPHSGVAPSYVAVLCGMGVDRTPDIRSIWAKTLTQHQSFEDPRSSRVRIS